MNYCQKDHTWGFCKKYKKIYKNCPDALVKILKSLFPLIGIRMLTPKNDAPLLKRIVFKIAANNIISSLFTPLEINNAFKINASSIYL